MLNRVDEYLKAHKFAMAASTYNSRKYRLHKWGRLIDGNAHRLYSALSDHGSAPYTIKTTFIIAAGYWDWCNGAAHGNPYREFMKKYRQLFLYAYTKEQLTTDYESARSMINGIEDSTIKGHALFLLNSGLRLSESYKVFEKGNRYYVEGKGGKVREVFFTPPFKLAPRRALYSTLKRLGLKPHSLRKLFATKLVKGGMDLQDVCKVMGWSSLNTAMSYLQSSTDSQLQNHIQDMIDG